MSERIVAIVPVRSLRDGKTRLAPVLGNEARGALLRGVADRVVAATVESGLIETVLVVSPDAETLSWAAGMGPSVVAARQPDHHLGLNGAIDAGRAHACGVTTENVASCWGRPNDGLNLDATARGTGAPAIARAPAAVSGQ